MSDAAVGIYTIGQTPRPDLTANLAGLWGATRLCIRGALDDLPKDRIPACGARGYPLETRLRDGTRVVVDAAFVEPLVQSAIAACDRRSDAHLVLCAGPFPRLVARKPLIRPFDVAVGELAARGFRSLEVLVPFAGQAAPAARKWRAAGFSCRASVVPESKSAAAWLANWAPDQRAEALVIDYVGLPEEMLEAVCGAIDIPAFDLGRLACRALEKALAHLDEPLEKASRAPRSTP